MRVSNGRGTHSQGPSRCLDYAGIAGRKKVEKHKEKELGFAVTSPVLFLLENIIIKNAQKNKKIYMVSRQKLTLY